MSDDTDETLIQCGCLIALAIFNILIGGWSVNYLLLTFLEKTLPFWGAALIGLFVGEFSIPVAIIVWVLHFLH